MICFALTRTVEVSQSSRLLLYNNLRFARGCVVIGPYPELNSVLATLSLVLWTCQVREKPTLRRKKGLNLFELKLINPDVVENQVKIPETKIQIFSYNFIQLIRTKSVAINISYVWL